MPNGYHGKADRHALERLDPMLEEFARKLGATITRDTRGDPQRTIRWGSLPQRIVNIYPSYDGSDRWCLTVMAIEDHETRYFKRCRLVEDVLIDSLEAQLPDLLQQSFELAMSWKSDDLKPV
jgi:hypothetical protein